MDQQNNQAELTLMQQPPVPGPQPVQPKSNKGLIIGLIIGGALFLLAIVATVLYFTIFSISKDNYRAAATESGTLVSLLTKVDEASSDYSSVVAKVSSSDEDIAAAKGDYEKALADYKRQVEVLADQRALRDGEAGKHHKAFVAKNDDYLAYGDSMAATMPTVRLMVKECDSSAVGRIDGDQLDRMVSQYDTAMKDCLAAVDDLTVSPNKDAARVGETLKQALADMREIVIDMEAAYKAQDRAAFEAAYNKIDEVSESMQKNETFEVLKKHEKELNPSDKIEELRKYLQSKS